MHIIDKVHGGRCPGVIDFWKIQSRNITLLPISHSQRHPTRIDIQEGAKQVASTNDPMESCSPPMGLRTQWWLDSRVYIHTDLTPTCESMSKNAGTLSKDLNARSTSMGSWSTYAQWIMTGKVGPTTQTT